MSDQIGTYYLGTFGFAIEVDTGSNLTGATAVNVTLHKPSGDVEGPRDLTAAAISDFLLGKILYKPEEAEVDEAGVYTFKIEVPLAGGDEDLVTYGKFRIAPPLDSSDILVVEDGSGVANANSYVTLEEAEIYHRANLYADEWDNATTLTKQKALISATRTIDANFYFYGWKVNDVQALEWPRMGMPNRNLYGTDPLAALTGRLYFWGESYYPNDVVLKPIKDATALLALELLKGNRSVDPDSKGLRALSLGQGAIDLTFDEATVPVPLTDEVQRILAPFGSTRYGGGIGRSVRV